MKTLFWLSTVALFLSTASLNAAGAPTAREILEMRHSLEQSLDQEVESIRARQTSLAEVKCAIDSHWFHHDYFHILMVNNAVLTVIETKALMATGVNWGKRPKLDWTVAITAPFMLGMVGLATRELLLTRYQWDKWQENVRILERDIERSKAYIARAMRALGKSESDISDFLELTRSRTCG